MGIISQEFEFITTDDTLDLDSSPRLVEKANIFISKATKYPDKTFQGIRVKEIADQMEICETKLIPWEHVKFNINLSKLRSVAGEKLEYLFIPNFAEEIIGVDTEFGINNTMANNVKYITLTANVLIINPNTFMMYKKLKEFKVDAESKLFTICSNAFAFCESLKELDLTNCRHLETIQIGAFDNSGIKTLRINSCVSSMCSIENTNIQKVYVDNTLYTRKEFIENMNDTNGEVFWFTPNSWDDEI